MVNGEPTEGGRGGGSPAWVVEVVEHGSGTVVKRIETTEARVDRVQSGLMRQLDCERYWARVRPLARVARDDER